MATSRRMVMEYRPLDYQESISKLAYISAFLIAAEARLEEKRNGDGDGSGGAIRVMPSR